MGGHHRSGFRRRRPFSAAAAALVVAAVLVGAMGVLIGVRAVGQCRPVDVVVAADPAVVEPVREALAAGRETLAGCARYEVVDTPATLATDIQAAAAGLPAVWIPESTLALGSLDTTSGAFVDLGGSLAGYFAHGVGWAEPGPC